MASLPAAETLRTQAAKNGTESVVKVNQRKLVDKILARYSSDFVVFRELIQNADDAHATSFDLSISCHNTNSRDHFSERGLHKSTITELRTSNNGRPFSKVDWERVAAIADGNVDVDSVGQFGVGFFSVFAYSDGPIITSGKEYLVFAWQNDHTLTTYRQKLSSNYQSEWTSIVMVMKHQFLLHTSDEQNKSHDKKFEKKHHKSIPVDEIIPIIDLHDLKIFLSRILSFTKHIKQVSVTINDTNVFQVNKSVTIKSSSLKSSAKHAIFQIRSLTHSEQTFFTTNNDSLSLEHVSVQAEVSIDETFHEMIRRSLKKSLPSQVSIQLLFASSRLSTKINDVLHSLMPVKWDHDSLVPTGLIFIGFATHQTTGIGFHIQSHLIPTIERESLDMQDPYIAAWNRELLTFSGQIVRSIYDRIMLKNISMVSDSRTAIRLLAPFAFQCTTPDQQIGMALLKGFLTSHDVLQVLARRSLDDDSFALIPSSQAFLSTSHGLEEFLTLPLVPFELVQKEFFSQLKKTGVMRDLSNQEIVGALTNEPLSLSALAHLMHWLRKEHCNDKPFFNHVLSQTRFKESSRSLVISMTQIQYYDVYQISTKLPLPKDFLPASVACQFSTDDLKLHFSLNTCSLQHYLNFYLSDEQLCLFRNGPTSEDLLRFFCKYSSQLTESNWETLTNKLSQIKCILTNQGMKFPKESYLPSTFVDENVPLIIFRLSTSSTDSHDDHSISTTFLKRIGCRMFDLRRLCKFGDDHRKLRSKSSINPGMKEIVSSLVAERSNLSLNDFKALREERFLTGRTLQSTHAHKELYAAHVLHFPSVAQKLNWPTLLIIDWIDIDRYSMEYSFLKDIGVRQVPELNILLERIIGNYQSTDEFHVSKELKFFAENFQTEYNNMTDLKKCERAFLPSIWPSKNKNSRFFLMPPSETFTESNPLFPVLIDAVKKLFEDNFRIDTLGIKSKPTLPQAVDMLTKRRQSLLKSKTRASYIFKYMNLLEGRTVALIDEVSNLEFIPLFQDRVHFAKPTEVFVRSADQIIVKNDQENIDTEGLIDYVDFGSDANAFLTSINVLPFPTSPILAQLLLDRQQNYLAVKNDCKKSINERLKIYLHCLKYLAVLHIAQNDLLRHPIRARLEKEPWCLAYQMVSLDNGENNTCGQIVCPSEVYLNDDEQLLADLQPLCAPAEKLVTDLYHALGSRWLSESAQRIVFHTGKTNESIRTHRLRDLIHSRLEMLFVNNRGVSLPDVDRGKIDLIKNTLTVFETDGFECKVQFQGKIKKIKAFSNRSCALEVAKNRVTLYLRRDVKTIEHFEVASELCRFVMTKQNEIYFDSITNRLVVPLETLKKRGIPVDRLMKTVESPITGPLVQNLRQQKKQQKQQPANASARVASGQSSTGNANNKRSRFWWLGFLYPPAWIRNRSRVEDQITQNPKHIESNLHVSYTPDFRSLPDLRSSTRMREIFSRNRPFNDAKLQRRSNEVREIIESCTMHPEMDLSQYSRQFNSILLFFDKGVSVTDDIVYNAEQLSRIINNLATQVFQISVESFHIFRDIKSAFIAFNRSGSVFFNLRYFEQIFADELNRSHDSASVIEKIINFYYLVACHELSHNVYPAHDINFMNQMQWMAVKYMPAKERSVHQMLGHTVSRELQRTVF